MRKLVALVVKDLFIHRRGVIGAWLFMGVFFMVLRTLKPFPGADDEMSFLILLNAYFLFLYTDWFIYREKTRGTFAFLRTMPVSDLHIVSSKFVVCVISLTQM